MNTPLLSVSNLTVAFPVERTLFGRTTGWVKAVDNVSFFINAGETLGLVGESGCGKTSLARAVARLIEPVAGSIVFEGTELLRLSRSELRKRRRGLQLVFQDPYSSLDPRCTVGDAIGEALDIHRLAREGGERSRRISELLDAVGLSSRVAHRYPHELSGGQRQRVGLARALAVEPSLLICDEPVSALDVSVQAQVINLLQDLQETRGLAYLLIAHDLAVVAHASDRVMVMNRGKLVESGDTETVIRSPQHPYTRSLLASVPSL